MIKINMEKAKNFTHDIRRDKRAKEFEPHDNVIMKQIPGNDLNAAEAARSEIRAKYDVIQSQIEQAVTPEELKQIIENMNS